MDRNLYISEGAKVMITSTIDSINGIANGCLATVK